MVVNPECGVGELSGLSWGGFNVTGDRASIDEVRRLIHIEGRVKGLEETIISERAARSTSKKGEPT